MCCCYLCYWEILFEGCSYDVFDVVNSDVDDMCVFKVFVGYLFMMGDDCDKSVDSCFLVVDGGGIGFVFIENL